MPSERACASSATSKGKTSSSITARPTAAPERFPQLAAELVRLNVDLIVPRGTPAVMAAKNATGTVPVVMAASGEPVGTGVVAGETVLKAERLYQEA
jgi:ABC-type uncharacterized transport system substrate-binding protein